MVWIKNKKISIPIQTPVFLYKSWFKGVYISRTCFPDDIAFKWYTRSNHKINNLKHFIFLKIHVQKSTKIWLHCTPLNVVFALI